MTAAFPFAASERNGLVEQFRELGWVAVDALDAGSRAALRAWTDEVAAWPADAGEVLQHFEGTDDGPLLCRSENFLPFHDGLRALLCSGPLLEVASTLLGEPAVLYKEKVNYKAPGGAGYSPHQDAPAYPMINVHVSAMIAIDDADETNGGLEVVSRRHHELLPLDERGCIAAATAAELEWEPVPLAAGQTLWFHSRTPHRSAPNHSRFPRRALYPTYNAASEGDLRDAYYETKLAVFAGAAPGDRARVSLIGDFEGRPV
jgi:hypothetical protein